MSTPAAPSFVRTLAPVAVGQLVAYLVTLGVVVPEDVEAALTVILGFVITSVYYIAVRFIEQKYPKFGALLGWAVTPDGYSRGNDDVVESEVVDIDETGPAH